MYLCILYLCVRHLGISFFKSLNNPLFKNIPHVGSFWHFVVGRICVFVYFVLVFFVFAHFTHANIIFDIPEQSSFQKYTTWWVFLAIDHLLYLCICVFVSLYFCICAFGTRKYHFWDPWSILFSKIYHMLRLERPNLRYVLKLVLHYGDYRISMNANSAVSQTWAPGLQIWHIWRIRSGQGPGQGIEWMWTTTVMGF